MRYLSIKKEDWDNNLEQLLLSCTVVAPVRNEFGLDYELLKTGEIKSIVYNSPKPATPLKSFFLPVSENVTKLFSTGKQRIIIGIPGCDVRALSIIDEIYLDKDFNDPYYRQRRDETLLISADCFGVQEHCHCTSYGLKPFDENDSDLAVILRDDQVFLRVISPKGEDFVKKLSGTSATDKVQTEFIDGEHKKTEELLQKANKGLPDYRETGRIVQEADAGIWKKYSSKCVSCGACTTICPTCTCFLLIDRPEFEKVKQMDACQYPGFARVAGGEDPLFRLPSRFRNRYMCKYVWKPAKFKSLACTGCGRCIEACIGKINKNELFRELA